jgi:hypothetical protein
VALADIIYCHASLAEVEYVAGSEAGGFSIARLGPLLHDSMHFVFPDSAFPKESQKIKLSFQFSDSLYAENFWEFLLVQPA